MATTKINRLTGMNIRALRNAQDDGLLPIGTTITATTVEFLLAPRDALDVIDRAKVWFNSRSTQGSRNSTTRSLAAVRRKIEKQIED